MDEEYIINAENIHKTYDTGVIKVDALKGVDVCIKPGEIVSIIGPSGCGKTTLLNCLSGLDDITDGVIAIEGKKLTDMSDNEKSEYRARYMGFIFQFYNLLPVLTAVENVELPLLISRENPRKAREQALKSLEMVELDRWANHKPAELSGGQRQRVTIARALVNNPLIVFGDEPTGDLDRDTSDNIMELIVKLNRENHQTFVIVTHDQKVAHRGHRVLKMGSGIIEKEYVPTLW